MSERGRFREGGSWRSYGKPLFRPPSNPSRIFETDGRRFVACDAVFDPRMRPGILQMAEQRLPHPLGNLTAEDMTGGKQ